MGFGAIMNKTRFGYFDDKCKGGYVITESQKLISSWEYIYENGDILLKVDQNGPVFVQANPVKDIVLLKREWNEKDSKWNLDILAESSDATIKTSVFGSSYEGKRIVRYYPDHAEYETVVGDLKILATLFVPVSGSSAGLYVQMENLGRQTFRIILSSRLMPYVNDALMAPWDKPEWYVRTRAGMSEKNLTFVSYKTSPIADKKARKLVTLNATFEGQCDCAISLEEFCGSGNFSEPQGRYPFRSGELKEIGENAPNHDVYGYPSVYAYRYSFELAAEQKHSCSQVLSMQSGATFDPAENCRASELLKLKHIHLEELRQSAFYAELFERNSVCTKDGIFDRYVNEFLPLQLHWVKNLDRGWPTGMRGVRDLSNDCLGLLAYDTPKVREVIEQIMSCQRRDGWFPRQISDGGKTGKHDLRHYNDGGAFVLELVAEYLKVTDDAALLSEQTDWLDSDEKSSVMEHILGAVDYYLDAANIGVHGLCKIYEGDWLDAVNRAGVQGRGESVMITCQIIMSLREVSCILKRYFGNEYAETSMRYEVAAEMFKKAVNSHALNKKGYYNSVYTDGGEWIFSDSDPDGEARIYGPVNSYTIVSGVAEGDTVSAVLGNLQRLRCEAGYRLFYPALGKKEISFIGRMATGDQGAGLWENGAVYNHGSHGFYARALAAAGQAETLKDVIEYMLPYNEEFHPVEKTMSPPYAIVNCYQDVPVFRHRGGMTFLTGTIAMAVRAVYNWMFGITPEFGGISFRPCLTKENDGAYVCYRLGERELRITYRQTGSLAVMVNGKKTAEQQMCPATEKTYPFVTFAQLQKRNDIIVEY